MRTVPKQKLLCIDIRIFVFLKELLTPRERPVKLFQRSTQLFYLCFLLFQLELLCFYFQSQLLIFELRNS